MNWTETIDEWVEDGPDSNNFIRGLRNSIAISLLLWAVIILALMKFF